MRHLVTDFRTPPDGLVVCLSVKDRQREVEIAGTVAWKWLAVDERVVARLNQERRRRGLAMLLEDPCSMLF